MYYAQFRKLKNLGMNLSSFITFMKGSLKPLITKIKVPVDQLNLFSYRQLKKLGSF